MSKFKNGLTVDRNTNDPVRRPRPVSQEGYYYPETHEQLNSTQEQQNSKRHQLQPMRQYGSSASLEVRRVQNQQQKERDLFPSSPSQNAPTEHEAPPSHVSAGHESFVSTREPSVGYYDLDYYYSDRMSRASHASQVSNYKPSRDTLSPPPPPVPIQKNSSRSVSPNRLYPSGAHFQNQSSSSLNSEHSTYLSSSPQPSHSPNISSSPHTPQSMYSPPSPHSVPDPHMSNNSDSRLPLPKPPFTQDGFSSLATRPASTESLMDPFIDARTDQVNNTMQQIEAQRYNSSQQRNYSPQQQQQQQRQQRKPPTPQTHLQVPQQQPRLQSLTPSLQQQSKLPPSPQQQQRQLPPSPQQQQRHATQSDSEGRRSAQSNRSVSPQPHSRSKNDPTSISEPLSLEDYVQKGIKYHEENQLEKSARCLRIAAERGSPTGMVLYGIALRHGWGCEVDHASAFKYLQKAAESAVSDPDQMQQSVNVSATKGELILAIYELGVCFRHGWGVPKNKSTAAYYFEIAANLGDPDAQNDIGLCYYKGDGVKKDMKLAAKFYRMAHAQGHGTMGNSWIFKEKYNES